MESTKGCIGAQPKRKEGCHKPRSTDRCQQPHHSHYANNLTPSETLQQRPIYPRAPSTLLTGQTLSGKGTFGNIWEHRTKIRGENRAGSTGPAKVSSEEKVDRRKKEKVTEPEMKSVSSPLSLFSCSTGPWPVERKGVEPSTSALRTQRSPN